MPLCFRGWLKKCPQILTSTKNFWIIFFFQIHAFNLNRYFSLSVNKRRYFLNVPLNLFSNSRNIEFIVIWRVSPFVGLLLISKSDHITMEYCKPNREFRFPEYAMLLLSISFWIPKLNFNAAKYYSHILFTRMNIDWHKITNRRELSVQ